MTGFIMGAIMLSAIGYFYGLFKDLTTWNYIFKPGTMLFMIVLVLLHIQDAGIYGWLILLGLVFSVTGDIYLMHPADRFIQGLISFFIAHVIYVIAFQRAGSIEVHSISIALLLIIIGVLYLFVIANHVKAEGGFPLLLAVIAYMTIISFMVYQAVLSGELILIIGACSFYLSDAILAWNRFIKKYPRGQFAVMLTYYFAQVMIAYSVALQSGF
ncbi:lysoplasmalogenase [Marininema halotolerans]|uniref:Uncharacterized membrane protein YhhN n=1 Tax=Marininema halotolerans TaxID=1155944 RepID=A0A1I6S787_9BACL|nr:lysoplasmalogenase [Marininema halotolerans]SFS72811.1 Uncharacterized membrane protein YhhN [Marininema halotolerans]